LFAVELPAAVTLAAPVLPPQPASVASSSTLLSAVKDSKSSQAASDIETSLSSLAAQLGAVGGVSENLQTDFLSAFVQLLQTQAVCQPLSVCVCMCMCMCVHADYILRES